MTRHVFRRLAVFATGLGLAAAGLISPAYATTTSALAQSPDGLRVTVVKHSLLATHTWYQQTYRGLPVLGGFYVTHTNSRTGAVTAQDGRLPVQGLAGTTAKLAQSGAQASVTNRLRGQLLHSDLVVLPGSPAKLGWLVLTDTAHGTMQTVVDANSGATLKESNTVKEDTGSGQVFNPNPVVTLQNESLTDQNNQDSAAFAAAYSTVTLTHLTAGVTTLTGDFADNVSASQVKSNTRSYLYNRSQDGFEQVMGYFHITAAQEYIQSLGFTDVNNEPQNYRTTGLKVDNSFYDPKTDRITYGTGGVDDAEDAEVIWHEYGHAIQDDQVPGFGSAEEAGAIGEGFGDYWAYTMSVPVSANTATTPLACIADWDSTSYTTGTPHCLRRVDGTKMYPGSLDGEVHDDGEIWSRALFDIHGALGRTRANTVILEAQFSFTPTITMPAAANQTVATAQALFGTGAANSVRAAFQARGIL